MAGRWIAIWAVLAVGPAGALAQRGEQVQQLPLEFTSARALRLGATTLAPGRYTVALVGSELALTHAATMQVVARVAAVQSMASEYHDPPIVRLARSGTRVTIELLTRDQRYSVVAEELAEYRAAGSQTASLSATHKTEDRRDFTGPTETYQQELRRAVERLGRSVSHCEDLGIRRAARLDDEKLELCICPIAARWRLPPAPRPLLRWDVNFPRKRHGYSLLIDAAGVVVDCRVWSARPPPVVFPAVDPAPPREGASTPQAADADAHSDRAP